MESNKFIKKKFNFLTNESINNKIILTRSIYLRSMGLIYLFAFTSLFYQLQGLWGDEGLLPASNLLKKIQENYKENANFFNIPTLLWFSDHINRYFIKATTFIGISEFFLNASTTDNSLYILCIIGIIFSFGIVYNFKFAFNPIGFFLIWIIYLSFFIIGQVFMSFQWDIFLLECGFITIFLCPLHNGFMYQITPVDNMIFHLIRFLMFRFIYSNGIVKVTSGCPTWLSFTALHYHFQSQPLPNSISYYSHFLPDGIKRIFVAITFFIEIYVPFLFFCFFRRINIYAGCLQFILQFGIICTGNYNFFNLITIVVNLSNFDDEFLRAFIPNCILDFFEIDPLNDIKISKFEEKRVVNKNENYDDENDKQENEIQTEEESNLQHQYVDQNETKNKDASDLTTDKSIPDEITKILKNKKLRKIIDNESDSPPKSLFYNSGVFMEITLLLNLFGITLLIILFYFYPMKNLLQGDLKLSIKDIQKVYNNNFLNYYTIYIFCYISLTFVFDVLKSLNVLFSSDVIYKNQNNNSLLSKGFYPLIIPFKNLLFFVFLILYYIHSVNIFYEGLDLKLVDRNSKYGLNKYLAYGLKTSEVILSRFKVNHSYGLFRVMTGVTGRPELEIKVLNDEKWESVNFIYKMSEGTNFSLKQNIPHQPRIDWQIWFSALARDLNSEPWLVIMLGKILENNPVTLDLLGYYIDKKQIYYKYSFYERFVLNYLFKQDRKNIKFVPQKIKIELYNYYFNTNKKEFLNGKVWTKKFIKEFLPPIDKNTLQGIFKMYDLPKIDEKRKIEISTFQMIPIIDIIILTSAVIFIYKFLFRY